jgi:hypothetical protein
MGGNAISPQAEAPGASWDTVAMTMAAALYKLIAVFDNEVLSQ